jgi:hypothetical protein
MSAPFLLKARQHLSEHTRNWGVLSRINTVRSFFVLHDFLSLVNLEPEFTKKALNPHEPVQRPIQAGVPNMRPILDYLDC